MVRIRLMAKLLKTKNQDGETPPQREMGEGEHSLPSNQVEMEAKNVNDRVKKIGGGEVAIQSTSVLNSEEIQCGQKSVSEQWRRGQSSQSRANEKSQLKSEQRASQSLGSEISQQKSGKKPKGRPVGWRKDTHMKKEKSNKEKSITHRCFPDTMMDFFYNKVYDKLSSKHKDLLSETPFLHLFCFPKKTQASNVVLHQILLMWDNTKRCFKFKGSILNFTSEEVSLVMCLPCKGKPVSYPREKGAKLKPSSLRNKYFEPNKLILRKDLEDKILTALEENHEAKDVVGLLVMYLFTTVLFPLAAGYVPVNMFQYAEDIESLCGYNWGNAVYRMLKDNIPACSLFCKKMEKGGETEKKPKGQNPKGQLPGCVLALIVWFFEHTSFSGALKNTGAIPRYLNWNLDKSWKRAGFVPKINDDRNVDVNGNKLEYDEHEQPLKGRGFVILPFRTMLVDDEQMKLLINQGVYQMLIQMSPILSKFGVNPCECIASQVQADRIQELEYRVPSRECEPLLPEVSSMVEHETQLLVEGATAMECSPKKAVRPLKKRKLASESRTSDG